MGKIVTVPESNYNHNNSQIGDISNITTLPYTFEVSNISVSNIKDVLGETTNNVSDLCKSNKVNQHALFRPNGLPPYSLGDFAGYNHNALPSTNYMFKYNNNPYNFGEWLFDTGNYRNIAFTLRRGERYPDAPRTWDKIRLRVVLTNMGTFYSDIKAIPQNTDVQFPVRISAANDDYTGNMFVYAEYLDTNNNVISNIEDSHPTLAYTIQKRWLILESSIFTQNITGVRAYYTYMQSMFTLTAIGTAQKSSGYIAAGGIGVTPSLFPESMQYNGNNHYFTGVIYGYEGSQLYRYTLSPNGGYVKGEEINSTTKVGNSIDGLYTIGSRATKTAYPTSISNL